MKKLLFYIFISFFFFNFSKAGWEGYGELKLSPIVLKHFKQHISSKGIKNKSMGSERHGRGWFFFVEENGLEFGSTYCPQGKSCTNNPTMANKICKKNIKKYLKRKGKCKLFARKQTIEWDGKKIKISSDASDAEIEAILRKNNFID
tara:strand:+ start:126 stop:566 length:441 start_codon:yes stop_codon:yes gene_type:complete